MPAPRECSDPETEIVAVAARVSLTLADKVALPVRVKP
jgi:hypothetical protein